MEANRFSNNHIIEIFVIVLSILLAFSLERLYEFYLDRQHLKELLTDETNELLYDYEFAQKRVTMTGKVIFPGIYNVVERIDIEAPKQLQLVGSMPFYSMALSTSAYKELSKFSEEIPEEYDSLMNCLNILKNRYQGRLEDKNKLSHDLERDYRNYVGKYEWFVHLNRNGELTKAGADFIHSDNYFYTLFRSYGSIVYEYLNDFVEIRRLSLLALFQIDKHLELGKTLNDRLPQNELSLSDDFKLAHSGQYFQLKDSTQKVEISFSNGYLTTFNGARHDFFYAQNDSTFQSLTGLSQIQFNLNSNQKIEYTLIPNIPFERRSKWMSRN